MRIGRPVDELDGGVLKELSLRAEWLEDFCLSWDRLAPGVPHEVGVTNGPRSPRHRLVQLVWVSRMM